MDKKGRWGRLFLLTILLATLPLSVGSVWAGEERNPTEPFGGGEAARVR